jgi:hypothetical protein
LVGLSLGHTGFVAKSIADTEERGKPERLPNRISLLRRRKKAAWFSFIPRKGAAIGRPSGPVGHHVSE